MSYNEQLSASAPDWKTGASNISTTLRLDQLNDKVKGHGRPLSDRSERTRSHHFNRRLRRIRKLNKKKKKDRMPRKTSEAEDIPFPSYDPFAFTLEEIGALERVIEQHNAWILIGDISKQRSGPTSGYCVVSEYSGIGVIRTNFTQAGAYLQYRGYYLRRKSDLNGITDDSDIYCVKYNPDHTYSF